MHKRLIVLCAIILLLGLWAIAAVTRYGIAAENALAERLAGRLLLQVESRGEIWYVDPSDGRRREITLVNAYDTFRELALGVTNDTLDAIPTAVESLTEGLDSDGDGYPDTVEAQHGYRLFGSGTAVTNLTLAKRLRGQFLLQVEDNGRIWYVHPETLRKHEITHTNMLATFQRLALGITNNNLAAIAAYRTRTTPTTSYTPPTTPATSTPNNDETVLAAAASAIMSGSVADAQARFTPSMQRSLTYTLNKLDSEGRFSLGNIMAGAKLTHKTSSQLTYTTTVTLGSYTRNINFYVQKQPDGSWLLANL